MPRKATAPAPVAEENTQAETRLVPLEMLYLHPLNPRKEPPAAEIEALAASIKAVGLLQNLSGFADHQIRFRLGHHDENPDHLGIVAGGRRLRALQLLAARGDWQGDVPVRITTDADLAGQWAGAENETQRGLSVVDRITAYAQMREKGHTVEAIASAFATPISDVRRQLALAILPEAALTALRSGKISYKIAQHLTSARDDATLQAALNAALAGKDDWSIGRMIRQGSVNADDRRARYVGLMAYYEAGGGSTVDLFENQTILHDEALLDQLTQEKGEAETEALREAEGWAWALFVPKESWQTTQEMRRIWGAKAELPEADATRMEDLESIDDTDLTEAEVEELQALQMRASQRQFSDEDRAAAGIVTTIDHNGALKAERAYLRKGDRLQSEAGDDSIEINRAAEASMPQNLKDDLRRIRLICIQDALRRDQQLCHLMLSLQMMRTLKTWETPFALDQTHAALPSKMDGMTIPAPLAEPPQDTQPEEPALALKALMVMDPVPVDRALYNGLARAFCRWDGPFVDAINARQPINARSLWTPNAANFFGRVSAGYLDALWRELVPDEGSRHAGFESLTKKEKVKELDQLFNGHELREAMGLSREVNTKIDNWLPEDLRFTAAAEGGEE
ncbi:ParB/RepB/Spo0J family partition protein [Pseudotabrizicola algicola]|uniref:ParB N-terminal domain-containing protein n=1 Tax=Pseudotabrizicola algicola TaxID=2709381 RepID=A0A6B3RJC4_9RHOB|nr:ParB/Srx family N-terminal domain-containing protein [Pseudotabrizicola algicola]NEX45213.1 ParB N-terminal domain-containing protein [Pseudotabrizicola algicola]